MSVNGVGQGLALVQAARDGDMNEVRTLLETYTPNSYYVSRAMFEAAAKGNLVMIDVLEPCGPISEGERGAAVVAAAIAGQAAAISHLYDRVRVIPSELYYQRYKEVAIGNAASKGHIAALECLLAQAPITRSEQRYGILCANLEGQDEAMRVLQEAQVRA